MRYGGFWRRTAATTIDLLLITIVLFLSTALAVKIKGLPWELSVAYAWFVFDQIVHFFTYVEGFFVSLTLGFGGMAHFWQEASMVIPNDPFSTFPCLLLSFFLIHLGYSLYHTIFEATALQGSPGKVLTGLRVVGIEGRSLRFLHALGRNLAKLLSTVLFGAGHLFMAFSRRKQGLHDRLAGTVVVQKKTPLAAENYPRWY